MKVKTVSTPSKTKPFRKSVTGSIQKKKFPKPTGAFKNLVKITDEFEELKSGKNPTGISCSKEPKLVKSAKKTKAKKEKNESDGKVPKKSIELKKSKEPVVPPKQKKLKKETTDGESKVSLKSKVKLFKSSLTTEVDSEQSEGEPKLDITKVEAAVNALFTMVKDSLNTNKTELWDEATPVHLVVTGVKLGTGPKRIIRIVLPNSLVTDTTDICLIVPDLVRGRNVDHEKTYHYYKELLAKNGIKNIKTILPARQVRVEFNEYEARRNLCHSHDIFLIDQKISGFMVKKLGKEFYIKRKFPITVKLTKPHLKSEIESKLHKTSFFLDYKGNTKTVQVGHMKQTPKQIAENILASFDNLAYNYPGGLKNIRVMLIKSPTSESLPIYFSMVSRNEVETPNIKSDVYSKDKIVEGELFGKRVLVKPNGDVKLLSGSEEESDYDEDFAKFTQKKIKNNTNSNKKDDEEAEQSDSSVDQDIEEIINTKEGSESDKAGSESDGGNDNDDDAEAEYLMEFAETKKLQLKKKRKREDENTEETNEVKNRILKNKTKVNRSVNTKNKKINKDAMKNKTLDEEENLKSENDGTESDEATKKIPLKKNKFIRKRQGKVIENVRSKEQLNETKSVKGKNKMAIKKKKLNK
ncbi:Ribosomal protein L1, 3-layer alpha/beta-sandwich,Ribosomal protein L1/ribosomal biogenesis [Cinara cedri]|uniref:Ribosomal protein L1, 3-layer alpha/beta-sandwich,Ribosomal protein L1/ribosomal biogenesis n=1 Tax=Cinara cedri TaxID=506608 RepID=A0A5E4MVQ2_9HEMI|nr:Ribosomal protein L1, 3-layer alpha/beta-sandwich,Ribosomal protein L1/ribosomal biogenesis [Cinara cedri]